jgi:hypothetical protein
MCAGTTPVCCAGATFDCAHVQCGCTTQLECATNADCGGLVPFCCINDRPPDATCSSNHPVARCEPACLNGARQMCDPNATTDSCINATCSNDMGDLGNAGLPANVGYGVCK